MSKLSIKPNVGYTKPQDDAAFGNYPNTIVEAIYWDKEKMTLDSALSYIMDKIGWPEPPSPPGPDQNYLTFEALEGGTQITFAMQPYYDGLEPLTIEASIDGGETWTQITASTDEHPIGDTPRPYYGALVANLNAGEKVMVRGQNEAYGFYREDFECAESWCFFDHSSDQGCYVYGNIMSLIDGANYNNLTEVGAYAFAGLFNGIEGNDYCWKSKDDKELLLPATTLAESCYFRMFGYNYYLERAPMLPAAVLAPNCYNQMFSNCSSLESITCLATDISATKATKDWFVGASDSATFTKAAGVNWPTGDSGIPSGWTVIEE